MYACRFARLRRQLAQFRIAGRKKRKAGGRKAAIVSALGLFQEMGDDGRRDRVEKLRAWIVAQEKSGEFVFLDQRDGIAVFAILHRQAQPISEKLSYVGGVSHHLDGRDQTFGCDQGAGRFQLPGGKPIAHDGVGRDLQGRDSIEKFFVRRLEQSQVRFVIDHRHVGGIFSPDSARSNST